MKNLSKFLAAAKVRYNFHGIVVEGGADKFGEYATSVSQDLHGQGKCEIEILQVLLRYAEKEKEVVENMEPESDPIKQLNTLFEQLRQTLLGTDHINEKISPNRILVDLNQICSRLDDRKYCSAYRALDTFEIIIKKYIKLLDTDSFVSVIAPHYSMVNNDLLRSLLAVPQQYDVWKLSDQMIFETRQRIFFSLLDLLSSSTRIASFLQNQFSHNDDVNQTVFNTCGSILAAILRASDNFRLKVTKNDLEKYRNTIFDPVITFLDGHFMTKKCSRLKEQQKDQLIQTMLSFIWNTADKTSTVPILIYANCPQACLRWLSLSSLDIKEYRSIMSILYNIARHDEGADLLTKYECAKILRQFKSEILDRKLDFIIDSKVYKEIHVLFYMTLAFVIDSYELRDDKFNNTIINDLVSTTIAASKSPEFRYEGFHISEPLIVLMKLCVNDAIIDCILQQNETLPLFCTTLERFLTLVNNAKDVNDVTDVDVLTIVALANILWSISFHNRYKNELIKIAELIKTLEKFRATGLTDKVLANSFIPHHMSSLTKAIHGIWENLFPSPPPKPQIRPETLSNSSVPIRSLMISYSHVNINFCRQLYDMLSEDTSLSVWVDFNNCKSRDLWEEIAHAIEQTDYVVFLMSKDYFNSKSCRQEVAYVTDTLKKDFIPVYIDADYKATGWLGIRIAGSTYIRFGKADFTINYDELLSMINKNRSTIKLPDHGSNSLPPSPRNKQSFDVKQWREKQINQWFADNKIIPELCQFYQFQNGNELLLYSEAMQTAARKNEFETIQLKFTEKFKQQGQQLSMHEFTKFVNALESLHKKYHGSL